MAFNGSGVFTRLYSWANDAASAIKIRADRMDAEMDGFATGLSTCITKDGQTTATANLPMGGFHHTNVSNATSRNHYSSAAQIMDGSLTHATTVGGTGDAITLTFNPAFSTIPVGTNISFIAGSNNTTVTTVAINGLAAVTIKKLGSTDLDANDIQAGDLVTIQKDATNFQLKSQLRTLDVSDGSITTAKIVDGNVTLSKISNIANMRVLGNTSGSSAAPSEITINDDDTLATASATTISTDEAIKAYIDNNTSVSVFEKEAKSAWLTYSNGGTVSLTHGLTISDVTDIQVSYYLKCVSAEGNWAVDDILEFSHSNSGTNSSLQWGITTDITSGATSVSGRIGSSGIAIANKTTGARLILTPANWEIKIKVVA